MLTKCKRAYNLISSPHYFYGRSVIRLTVHNLVQYVEFFKRRGPSKELLAATKALRNSKEGKKALVLGSGPSIEKLIPDNVPSEFDDIFVVNNFYLHSISQRIIPDYYCLSDPNYFVSDKTNAIHTDSDVYEYIEKNDITLLISHFYRNFKPTHSVKKLFFDDREWRNGRKNISPLGPRSYGSFTLYKALAFACFLGYDEICILGLDNTEFKSYIGSSDNKIYVDNATNYAKSSVHLEKSKLPEGFTSGMAGRMQSHALQFGDLNKFSKFNIINLDSSSLVDAFRKAQNHPCVNHNGVQQ